MKNEILLLTPGPTMTTSKSKEIMGSEVIHHRSQKSWDLFSDTKLKLKLLAQTNAVTSDCVILTSSGTGAMEASIVNFVNSQDKILVFDNGYFSQKIY